MISWKRVSNFFSVLCFVLAGCDKLGYGKCSIGIIDEANALIFCYLDLLKSNSDRFWLLNLKLVTKAYV